MSSNDMPAAPLTGSTSGNANKRSRGSGSPLAEGSEEEQPRKKRSNGELSPIISSDTEVSVASVEDGREGNLVNHLRANDDNHNYSITGRWKTRNTAWENLSAALCADLDNRHSETELKNALDTFEDTFEDACKTKLFMSYGGESPLGRKVLAFKTFIANSLREIAELAAEKCKLAAEKCKLAAEKQELETKLQGQRLGSDISDILNNSIKDKENSIKDKDTIIKDKDTIIKKEKSLIKNEAAKVTYFISMVSNQHQALRSKLSVTKSKGNETAGKVYMTATHDSRIATPAQVSPAQVDGIGPVTDQALTTSLTKSVGQPIVKILQSFHGYAVELFDIASKTEDETKVKNTVDALIAWEQTSVLDVAKMYARPPTADDKETSADQPILQAIISRVIRILAEGDNSGDAIETSSVLHEDEHGITSEQVIPSEGDRSRGRRVDGTVHPPEEYLPAVLALMLQLSVEIKTSHDLETMRNKAFEKGRSQVVGHLGKQLAYSFDFGGAGKNASNLGVVLTTGSIEVIEMKLTGVGTLEVDLSAVGTGVKAFLGTQDDNGFVLLAGALKRARRDEIATDEMMSVSQIVPGCPPTTLNVQSFLGSGAFSNVVKLGESEFMKIPKAACLAPDLEHEAKILMHLQCNVTNHGIPIPASLQSGVSTIQTVVRNELSSMTCLRLHGVVGTPLNKLPRNNWQTLAEQIVSQVVAALVFAHKKKVYHLDVRPGNIIVKPAESHKCAVLLSDWGCSIHQKNNEKLKKFRGCTPYAHDCLLGEWSPKKLRAELDFASLLYTCIHVDKGILQWAHAFHRPLQVSTADRQMRRDRAKEFVETKGGLFSKLDITIQKTLKSVVIKRAGLRPRRNSQQ
jgi:hypothetical protein